MAATSFNITPLDFDTIKANFIAYLQDQDQFADYDFEGSNLAVLIDLLSYATHYNAVYANMTANEMFLDSAVQRGSIVSHAKELGYTPRSALASKATINVSFDPPGDPDPAIIEKGTKFNTSISGRTYVFVTTDDISVTPVDGLYSQEIDIYQGQYATYKFPAVAEEDPKFVIPNLNVDLRFITVNVRFAAGSPSVEEYTLAEKITELTSASNVYFLQENLEGHYELHFGDGILGTALELGNIVEIEYLLTSAEAANGATVFAKVDAVAESDVVTVATVDAASGGHPIETTTSIQFLAPRIFQAQERVVTKEDWAAIIQRDYPGIDSVAVWGGEDNDPPYYGKVFIAINPTEDAFFSATQKQDIIDDLKTKYNIMAIRPEIVDPEFLYVVPHIEVTYNSRATSLTAGQITSSIREAVIEYFATTLNTFNATLRYSNLSTFVDAIQPFFVGNIIWLKYKLRMVPTLGTTTQYTLNFSNGVNPGSFESDTFVVDGVTWALKDVAVGTEPHETGLIKVFRTVGDVEIYLTGPTGTINYETGAVVIGSLRVDSISDADKDYIGVVGSPASAGAVEIGHPDLNVYTNEREQILTVDPADIEIHLHALTT